MTSDVKIHDMASADPRHRSFHLTRPAAYLDGDGLTAFASGWVRILDSDGTPTALRISRITKVIGPYEIDDNQWVVRLVTPEETTEPIGFEDRAGAEHFVDDLLHDD